MARINRLPHGLQDLLGNTNLGINPAELLEAVRPSVDLWALWTAERVSYTEESVANVFGTQFDSIDITVPVGELWIPTRSALEVVQGTPNSTTTVIFDFGVDDVPNRFGGFSGTIHLGTDGGFAEEKIMVPPLAQVWSYTWRHRVAYFGGTKFVWTVMKNSLPNDFDVATMAIEYIRLEI